MKPLVSRGAGGLAIAAVAVALAWYSFATSMGQVFQVRKPELALKFDPRNSVALSNLAFARLGELKSESGLEAARAPTLDALRSAPGDAKAIFVAGVTTDRGRTTPQAVKRVQLSLKFSRRNVAAYLWLIEERTSAEDIDGALNYYDLAMRSSPEAREILLPIMIAAMDDPALGGPISNVLARGSNWSINFWEQLVQATPFPASVGAVVTGLSGSKGAPSKGMGDYVIQRLVDNLRFDEAADVAILYYPALKARDQSATVGQFVSPNIPSPFSWQFTSNADIATSAAAPDRLSLEMFSSNGGIYARKLLQLRPGHYTVDATLRSEAVVVAGSPMIRMRCANDNSPLLEAVAVQYAKERGKFQAKFTVVPSCRAEWLEIASPATVSATNGEHWELSALRIREQGAR